MVKTRDCIATDKPKAMTRAKELAQTGYYEFVYQVESKLREEGFDVRAMHAHILDSEERAKLRAFLKNAKKY